MIRLHLLFEPTHFGLHIVNLFESRKRGGMHRFARAEINVLVEQPEPKPIHLDNLAVIRSFLAGDEPKNRSFARAVSADEADFFIRVYLKRHALKDLGAAVRFPNI